MNKTQSRLTKMKIGFAHFGRIYSNELKEHNRQALLRPEVRRQKSEARKGEKSHLWKGGLTSKNIILRESFEYDVWRTAVFERDNYTCQKCGARCGNGKAIFLNADHIKSWAEFPDLRFVVENGRTLCEDCHKKTETFGRRIDKSTCTSDIFTCAMVG
jgi:5-methylcytosine-specific restriction endonuclease McrA